MLLSQLHGVVFFLKSTTLHHNICRVMHFPCILLLTIGSSLCFTWNLFCTCRNFNFVFPRWNDYYAIHSIRPEYFFRKKNQFHSFFSPVNISRVYNIINWVYGDLLYSDWHFFFFSLEIELLTIVLFCVWLFCISNTLQSVICPLFEWKSREGGKKYYIDFVCLLWKLAKCLPKWMMVMVVFGQWWTYQYKTSILHLRFSFLYNKFHFRAS